MEPSANLELNAIDMVMRRSSFTLLTRYSVTHTLLGHHLTDLAIIICDLQDL